MNLVEDVGSVLVGKLLTPQAILETNQNVVGFITRRGADTLSMYQPADAHRAMFGFDHVCIPLFDDHEEGDFLKVGIPYDMVSSVDGTKEGTRLIHSFWLKDTEMKDIGIDISEFDPRIKSAFEVVEKTRKAVYAKLAKEDQD